MGRINKNVIDLMMCHFVEDAENKPDSLLCSLCVVFFFFFKSKISETFRRIQYDIT